MHPAGGGSAGNMVDNVVHSSPPPAGRRSRWCPQCTGGAASCCARGGRGAGQRWGGSVGRRDEHSFRSKGKSHALLMPAPPRCGEPAPRCRFCRFFSTSGANLEQRVGSPHGRLQHGGGRLDALGVHPAVHDLPGWPSMVGVGCVKVCSESRVYSGTCHSYTDGEARGWRVPCRVPCRVICRPDPGLATGSLAANAREYQVSLLTRPRANQAGTSRTLTATVSPAVSVPRYTRPYEPLHCEEGKAGVHVSNQARRCSGHQAAHHARERCTTFGVCCQLCAAAHTVAQPHPAPNQPPRPCCRRAHLPSSGPIWMPASLSGQCSP